MKESYLINDMKYTKNYEDVNDELTVSEYTIEGETVQDFKTLFSIFTINKTAEEMGMSLENIVNKSINSVSHMLFDNEVKVAQIADEDGNPTNVYVANMILVNPNEDKHELTLQKWFLDENGKINYIQFSIGMTAGEFCGEWINNNYPPEKMESIILNLITMDI